MDALTTIALAKALTKQAADMVVGAGDYVIDRVLTIKVQGTVKKLTDVQYTPTVDIPMLPTMALLLQRMGVQREKAKEILVEVMTEALNENVQASELMAERVRDIETAMQHVVDVTSSLPKKTRAGATKVDLTIEEAVFQ